MKSNMKKKIKMPLPLRAYDGPVLGREHFRAPEDDFIFFFMFDF